MSVRRSIAIRLLLLAVGLGIGVLVAELTLRVVGAGYPQFYMVDEHTGSRLRPGGDGWWRSEGEAWIEINSAGFRDHERTLGKPPDTFRVAVIGDSFVEALQVRLEDAFTSVLDRELETCAALAGKDVEVLSFGVSGWGTAQELLALQHHVLPYAPDLVIVAFFPGNDLRNNSFELEPERGRPFFRLDGDALVLDESFKRDPIYLKAQARVTKLKVAVASRSRLLQLLLRFKETRNAPATPAPIAEPAERDALAEVGLDDRCFVAPTTPDWQRAWAVTERLLVEARGIAEAAGAHFAVLTVSIAPQVHPDADKRSAYAKRLGVEDLMYPARRLRELGAREGLHVIDIPPRLLAHAESTGEFAHGFANTEMGTGHWNVLGHRLVGQWTAEETCARAGD